jgi:5-methylcytosine-specific restriction endonuclease McrA
MKLYKRKSKYEGQIFLDNKGIYSTCPTCGVNCYHSTRGNATRAVKNNSECTSCSKTKKPGEYAETFYSERYLGGKWSKAIKERDKCCQVCGSGVKLEAHHIFSRDAYPELRYILNNGITLCRHCHKEFHAVNGKKQLTLKNGGCDGNQ